MRLVSLHLIVLVFLGVDRVSRVVQVLVVAALLFCCLFFALSFRAVLAVATHVLPLVENVWLHLQLLVLDDDDDALSAVRPVVVLTAYFALATLESSFLVYFLQELV